MIFINNIIDFLELLHSIIHIDLLDDEDSQEVLEYLENNV